MLFRSQIGVKWDTAWLIKQKLMEVMRQRNSIYKALRRFKWVV